MSSPIALQLYSIREILAESFEPTIRRIAEMGYVGVEPYNSPLVISKEAGELYRELGFEVPSAHIGLPIGETKNQVLEGMEAIGSRHIVSPWMNPDYYTSRAKIKGVAEQFNEACRAAAEHGMRFSIHNHAFEFEPVEGKPAYQLLLEWLEPEVLFQVDTYWVQTAGVDPAAVVRQMGSRAPSLHIKDGPAEKGKDSMALGRGVMDIAQIIQAGGSHTEWLVVELDSCATDMMEAVAESYDYLVSRGLARGRK